ncbi:allophanate hydrolase [Actinosynnema sp. ALI-1.44]|uniref:5-oxoprolinase subunit C family protein n=1 Tax=Actinosynnema sp. ALI-1.44 TaxID=1933779 RepID=UPI00097BC5FA|nr:biotin-dependent carboxyltransferase family protein [Actinosynnema sp. ALI-1.44]ONI87032.1 allophanate hydrolase [Actinosynnema sp. ALI-1.44]
MLTVLTPGARTLVQDLGRDGQYAIGLPPSGALDQYSHRCANLLVGNHENAATLEIAMIGPALHCAEPTVVAVTGGDADVRVDGVPVSCWQTVEVPAGQVLQIGTLRTGCHAYLAVRGGIATEPFLGSRSTYQSSAIGGHEGRPLEAGDTLPVGDETDVFRPGVGSTVDPRLRPALGGHQRLRLVEGLCRHRFTDDSVREFFASTFTVSAESDRTGRRLTGPALRFVDREAPFGAGDNPSNVVDLGYPVGSVQVPNGEEAICLLRDAVTGGGYATIGTVVSADLDVLAQLKAPDTVHFVPVSLDQAIAARQERRDRVKHVRRGLRLLSLY